MIKSQIIKLIASISLCVNVFLACIKIITGIIGHSNALLGDGIDSLSDVLIAGITLIIVKIMVRPADKTHPWGHGRAETVGTAFLSFTIFFVGTELIVNSVYAIVTVSDMEIPSNSTVIIACISIIGKLILALIQYGAARNTESPILKAHAKNTAGDVLISGGVLIGIGCSIMFKTGIVDPIIAILIGAWIIKSAVSIFLEITVELMDGNSNPELYTVVFEAVASVHGAVHPHRTRIRNVGGYWDIDIDIEVDPFLTVQDAHSIASDVEQAIKLKIKNIYDIVVHVEPKDDINPHEGYGLSEL
ncbi:MAG: cation diffusion facilitator family transporter [Treponema sp.]|jgi:cation diffusion facilitator family transporter|nr:cation diffusion facilitator family transporter [Treponema sp.]